MGIARRIAGWVNGKYKPIIICEAEIRDELEFHLDMRTRDNEAAGMTEEEARRDAQARFGDFDKQYEACRQVTLEWPLALRRLQVLLVVGLLIVVACQAWALIQAQTKYETELKSLRSQLEASQSSTGPAANLIPDVKWEPAVPSQATGASHNKPPAAAMTNFVPGTLDEPWSDWSSLSEASLPESEIP